MSLYPRQARLSTHDFLIASCSELALPVTCVEHGRWHPTSRHFSSGEMVYASLRRETNRQVKESLRMGRQAAAEMKN